MLTYWRNGMGGVDGTGKALSVDDGARSIGAGQDRGEKNPFDRWLTQKLRGVFDTISHEPLPTDLMNLVQQLEAKEKASSAQMQLEFGERTFAARTPPEVRTPKELKS